MRSLLPLSFLVLVLFGCSSPKPDAKPEPYADLKAVYLRVIDAQEQLAAGLGAASDAKRVAVVLKTYTAKMREIGPELNQTQARYPEFRSASEPPAELSSTVESLTASNSKMMEQLIKVQQYLEDPDVTAAMNDLTAAARE